MKNNGPKLRRRDDDLGDRIPNDWLEFLIILVAGVAVFGGFVALYYLSQQL
jgi:hypothetical protein